MTKNKLDRGAAYRCSHCAVWWGIQVGKARKTGFLSHSPKNIAPELPWDEYRGWREQGLAVMCPECGQPRGELVYTVS